LNDCNDGFEKAVRKLGDLPQTELLSFSAIEEITWSKHKKQRLTQAAQHQK